MHAVTQATLLAAPDATLFRIRNWNTLYENNRTRELKNLDWLPIPNKQDGDGYTLIMSQPDGAAIFGAWIACAQVASRCGTRGTLVRDSGKPHDSASLARMTRIPVTLIDRMLSVCSSADVNWLEIHNAQVDATTCENPAPSCGVAAPLCDIPATPCLEGKGREGKGKNVGGVGTPPAATPQKSDAEFLLELKSMPCYSTIDIDREWGKMMAWCSQRHSPPTRRRFVNWLNRIDKPMNAPVVTPSTRDPAALPDRIFASEGKTMLAMVHEHIRGIVRENDNWEFGLAKSTIDAIAWLEQNKPDGWEEKTKSMRANRENYIKKALKTEVQEQIRRLNERMSEIKKRII